MKKTLFIYILLIHVILPAAAERTYTADFLTFGTGARPLGMGNAFTAIADEASTTYYNPAGIAQLTHHEFNFMHATLADLAAYDVASYIYPFSPKTTFGISWLRVGVDDIPITGIPVSSRAIGPNNRPYVLGTFSNTSNAFLLSGARHLTTLPRDISIHLGASLKLIYIAAYRNTNAIGGGSDLGILAKTDEDKSTAFSMGIVASDFFTTKLYWNTPPENEGESPHTETLLPRFKIGVAYHQKLAIFSSKLTLAADVDTRNDYEFHTGAEYILFDLLALRCGFDGRNGTSRAMYFTAGAGLQLRFVTGAAFHVDYAYQRQPDLGISNRLSLRVRF
ncbi:MAG: PorV/PorQ family protein [Candidatus Poribacteria bacterium]|nr:PorV/PorQ family protein [Candidatus Poribacteria bacterium]